MSALTLGPLSFPLSGMFFLIGLLVAFKLTSYMERRHGFRLEPDLWLVLLVGALAARLGHIVLHWSAYSADWVGSLSVWQTGYSLPIGLMAVALMIAWREKRQPGQDHSMLWLAVPLLAGTMVWQGLLLTTSRLAAAHQIPAIELVDVYGRTVNLQEFQGRPTVINVWASWCPPCRREMPALSRTQQKYPEINFVFVNHREAAPTVTRFLGRLDAPLDNVLLDRKGKLVKQVGIRAFPTTLFLDASGRVVSSHLGELSQPRVEQYLNRIR